MRPFKDCPFVRRPSCYVKGEQAGGLWPLTPGPKASQPQTQASLCRVSFFSNQRLRNLLWSEGNPALPWLPRVGSLTEDVDPSRKASPTQVPGLGPARLIPRVLGVCPLASRSRSTEMVKNFTAPTACLGQGNPRPTFSGCSKGLLALVTGCSRQMSVLWDPVRNADFQAPLLSDLLDQNLLLNNSPRWSLRNPALVFHPLSAFPLSHSPHLCPQKQD